MTKFFDQSLVIIHYQMLSSILIWGLLRGVYPDFFGTHNDVIAREERPKQSPDFTTGIATDDM